MAEIEGAPAALSVEASEEASVKEEIVVGDAETQETTLLVSENKRKHEDIEAEGEEAAEKKVTEIEVAVTDLENGEGTNGESVREEKLAQNDVENEANAGDGGEAKRQLVEVEANDSAGYGNQGMEKIEAPVLVNGTMSSVENHEQPPAEELEEADTFTSGQGEAPSGVQQETLVLTDTSRKIEVPNTKVGVLIGKAGDTIRYLQYNSGAKIQITRDTEADPYSSTRPVELIGSVECIYKAEQLIKDVIAEADAGGSPALVARGFSTTQSGSEQLEIQVPNEKVGLVIGKGGETIKNLQTRSGARIQLIPQHPPDGDQSKVRTVRISGNKKQIETATEMIQDVMNQLPGRHSSFSGSGEQNQQTHRPHGPTPHWGPRAVHPAQSILGYDYQERGMYPSQIPQYPPAYGGYQQQPPPRGGYSGVWDQKTPIQASSQAGGYDYYGQGGPPTESQPSGHLSAPTGNPTPSGDYYGQPQVPGYGQPTSYSQSIPTQQNYGRGYHKPKYDIQAPGQQMYGQQGASQSFSQQPYNRPAYGGTPPQGPPQSYGQPRPNQLGDQMYQGSAPNYGSGGPSQQQYPYASGGPLQMTAYDQPYGAFADGYVHQPSSGYSQQGGPTGAGYTQPGQAVPTFPQPAQSGAYAQYPQPQSAYSEQPVPGSTPGYGYQGQGGSTDPAYAAPAPSSGKAGHAQQPANESGYEQSASQSDYGNCTGGEPASYS